MFPHTVSLASTGRQLSGFALGLTVLGGGFALAQDRGRPVRAERPSQSQPMERPMRSMERPPARVMSERPVQGTTSPRPAAAQGSVSRPSVRGEVPIRPATNAIIVPRPMPRCMGMPTMEVWRHRDILAEIQAMARRGFIVVHPVREDQSEFTGVADFPAGWIAYGFRVPPGESIHVRLTHSNEGWFRLAMMNKWGSLEQGMLQNLIPTGNPEVKYTNPNKDIRSVYVLVDDPGWMSSQGNPFAMKVTRSWDPTKMKVDDAPIVTGIWAQKKEEAKPVDSALVTTETLPPTQPKS